MTQLLAGEPALILPPADVVGAALRGPQRAFAVGAGGALRYRPGVANFASIGPEPSAKGWSALDALPGDELALFTEAPVTPPPSWRLVRQLPLLQMTGAALGAAIGDDEEPRDPEVEPLTDADVPEMLELVARTRPGPFLAGTIALGGYACIRRDGAIAAMAGRRLHPEGWIEVSGVCTDPALQGQGLGRRIIAAVVREIRAEGALPFLHVLDTNPAIRLYESMGFETTRRAVVSGLERQGREPALASS